MRGGERARMGVTGHSFSGSAEQKLPGRGLNLHANREAEEGTGAWNTGWVVCGYTNNLFAIVGF